MSRGSVGRNDPCPCGSGKKYKHCCLRKDQAQRRRQRGAAPSSAGGSGEAAGVLQQIRHLRQRVRRIVPEDQARELEEQADEFEALAAYAAKQNEIAAAMETLEEHRGAMEKMMGDPESAMKRTLRLVSEERFDDIRITAEDLNEAFEVVGYPNPSSQGPTDRDMKIMVEAAIHLAGGEEDRLALSRRLLTAVPDYVAAGRYLDAWLLQYSAYRVSEEPEEGSPFIFAMVKLALGSWADRVLREQEALFAGLGVDRSQLAGASLEEALALAEDLAGDSERVARLERFYETHPEVRSMAEERAIELEREATALIEREDAKRILPSPDETMPWVRVFMERTAPLHHRAQSGEEWGGEPDADLAQEANEILWEVLREMRAEVYTRERVQQLVAGLKAYGEELRAAGEDRAAGQVDSALVVTRCGMQPEESRFLLATCYGSMRLALKAVAEAGAEE